MQRTRTLGVIVDAAPDLSEVVALIGSKLAGRAPMLVTFVNPHSRAVARKKPEFVRQLEMFDVVLPDGFGMSLAIGWLHRIRSTRISFDMTSLAPEVIGLAERSGYGVALVGGLPGSPERACSRLLEVFPGLRVLGVFDGYGDLEERAARIAAIDPHIVICGMGVEAQEAMLLALARTGWRGCGFTCGGYFDQLSERLAYYPGWIDRYNLRWAYRLAREPRRLWRRYILTYPPFIVALGIAVLIGLVRGHRAITKSPVYDKTHAGFVQSSADDASDRGAG